MGASARTSTRTSALQGWPDRAYTARPCPWRLSDLLLRVQGTLLAIMNVLVFVLPLYELSQNLRKPATAFRAKATECIRSIRQKLGYPAASPATQGPSEAGRGQASSHRKAAVVAAEGPQACRCAHATFAMWRSLMHRLPLWTSLGTAPPLACLADIATVHSPSSVMLVFRV